MSLSRVIEVSFNGGSIAYVKADTAYFYNNGILFKPTDIELPASYQVHWADSPQASSTLETIGTAEGAPIPDDLWGRSRVIYGWIYLHPTEDSGVTAYEVRIYKNVRAGLPDGTEPTPAEQSTIDQLISALNGAVEQAEDAQEAIENMSVSATTLAEGASATVTKSEQDGVVHLAFGIPKGATGDDGYSPTANVSKSGKTSTITITDKNGTTSAQVEDGEDGIDGISPSVSVTDITGGHRVVITDKDGAKSFDVEDGATGATPNLTIGTVETLEPTDDATATITGTAENPVLNFGIPKGDTGEVTLDEFYKAFPTDTASGSIASFSDGADDLPLKSLVVDINPVQDLHGQANPYPAGGGKNKFGNYTVLNAYINSAGEIKTSVNDRAYVIACKPNTTYTFKAVRSKIDGTDDVHGGTYSTVERPTINSTGTRFSGTNYNSTTNLSTFSFTTGENDKWIVLKILNATKTNEQATLDTVQVEEGSSVSEYSPYENICPISGWTEATVNRTGINQWDEEWEVGSIGNDGSKIASTDRIRSKNYIPVVGGATYYIKVPSITTDETLRIALYDADNDFIAIVTKAWNGPIDWTLIVPNNCCYILFRMPGVYGTTYNHDISINYPSTDHDYHPYTGRSITIDLGQTVYGGKLDVLSGELVIDRAMVDLGTLDWRYTAANNGVFYQDLPSDAKPLVGTAGSMCSMFAPTKGNDWQALANGDYILRTGLNLVGRVCVAIRYNEYTVPTDFKAAVTGQTLVYELATPIEMQLSDNQVNSLLGVNNLWADSGDTTAEYRADTKLYIERLTAPDSADMIADANITSGQYFMVGNSLYKATANIANGSAIIVGTNCICKSLSEALNEINA